MKQRCLNPRTKAFDRYGGRGITVCGEWLNFENFYAWAVSNGYKEGLTIERTDNDGNYEPGNCKFATMNEQSNNRKSNHLITYKGKTLTLAGWGKELGFSGLVILKRIMRGWSIEKAIETPLQKNQFG
jgi:hypothetical protein